MLYPYKSKFMKLTLIQSEGLTGLSRSGSFFRRMLYQSALVCLADRDKTRQNHITNNSRLYEEVQLHNLSEQTLLP